MVVLHVTLLVMMFDPGRWQSWLDLALMLLGLMGGWECWRASAAVARHLEAHKQALGRPGTLAVFPRLGDRVLDVIVPTAVFGAAAFAMGAYLGAAVGWLAALATFLLVLHSALHAGRYPVDGRPALVMDGRGLEHAWLGDIDWPRIHGLALVRVARKPDGPRVPMVLIAIDDAASLRQRIPAYLAAPPAAAAAPELLLPLDDLDVDAGELVAFARRQRDAARPPPPAGWQPGADSAALARQLQAREEQLAGRPVATGPDDLRLAPPRGATVRGIAPGSRLRPPPPLAAKEKLSVLASGAIALLGAARLLWLYWSG